jgi:two-component system response regulator GlrR
MPPDHQPDDTESTELRTFGHVTPKIAIRSRPELRWTDGSGSHVATIERRAVVGSAPGVDVVVSGDRTISRFHAELDIRDGELWIRDLGSSNGTHLEGIRVVEARVPDRGKIELGSTVIQARYAAKQSDVELWPLNRFGPLIGRSEAMLELFATLARVAKTESSVLIQGETGTGKELVARAIHDASGRAGQPFVVVDCAAIPENLLEAELFGHAKGAFTGAAYPRNGAFEDASGGTLFLDEVGELALSMQPKLLRALEARTVRRLGETTYRSVDIRVLCATHRDLPRMVNEREFREDLYFRLSVIPITVPALRQRPEDIPALVAHFLADEAAVTAELMQHVLSRPWRGNVRELRNFVEQAKVLGLIKAIELPKLDGCHESPSPSLAEGRREQGSSTTPESSALSEELCPPASLFEQPFKYFREQWIDWGERSYVERLLARHERNVASGARAAGFDRTYLYRLMRKHDL